MRKLNKKASAIGGEAVIVFAIVILILIMGTMFLFRSNINSWMKNLPGFTGPGEEDREIGIDLEITFDCKYPIGQIANNEISLIRHSDLKEREFTEILENKVTLYKSLYFFISTDRKKIDFKDGWLNDWPFVGKIFGTSKTVAKLEDLPDAKGAKSHWKRIKLENTARTFAFDDSVGNIGSKDIPPNLHNLKDDLALLDNARYHQSTGLLCRDQDITNPNDLSYIDELGELDKVLKIVCALNLADYTTGTENLMLKGQESDPYYYTNRGLWLMVDGLALPHLKLICMTVATRMALLDAFEASNVATEAAGKSDQAQHDLMMAILRNTQKIQLESEKMVKSVKKINLDTLEENQREGMKLMQQRIIAFEKDVKNLHADVKKLYDKYNEYKKNEDTQKVGWFRRIFFREKGSEFSEKEYTRLVSDRRPIRERIVSLKNEIDLIVEAMLPLEKPNFLDPA